MHRIDWWMKKENQFSAAATSCEGRALAVHGYTILQQQQQRKIKSCWKSPAAAFNRVYGFGRCTPPNIGTIYKLVYLLQQKLWFRPLLEAVVRTTRSWEVKKEKKKQKEEYCKTVKKTKSTSLSIYFFQYLHAFGSRRRRAQFWSSKFFSKLLETLDKHSTDGVLIRDTWQMSV